MAAKQRTGAWRPARCRVVREPLRAPGPTAPHPTRNPGRFAAGGALAAALIAAAAAGAALASTGTRTIVSQRGRAFLPGALTVRQGDTVEIVNDDGDLMHHAYIDDPGFSFDSGDQEPGAKADIAFTKAGRFTVLCGIHPKMKLVVTVQD